MEEKEYTNGEVTIVWKPDLCQHSGICVKMLPQVYNPAERPWIKPENAASEEIIRQVSMCPSGALTIKPKGEVAIKQEDDKKHGRFFIEEAGIFAGEMTYTWAGNSMVIIDHTDVAEIHKGKGFGKKLLQKTVEFARENDLKVIPLCPFAKAGFEKDPTIRDVLK